jgi:uncharacterized protein
LGPAITFLFVGPAINILAITYTGAAIGFDIALARLILSIVFGILIGLIMVWIFRKEEKFRVAEMEARGIFTQTSKGKPAVWALFLFLVAILIVGTRQVNLLPGVFASIHLPIELNSGLGSLPASINLTFQGASMILMLVVIGVTAWKGFDKVLDGFDGWTYAVSLVAV